jgi:hypothetical protein
MTVIQPPGTGGSITGRSPRIVRRLISYAVFFFAFFCAIGLVECLLVPKPIDTGIAVPLGEALFVDLLVTTAYICVGIFLEERNLAGGRRMPAVADPGSIAAIPREISRSSPEQFQPGSKLSDGAAATPGAHRSRPSRSQPTGAVPCP